MALAETARLAVRIDLDGNAAAGVNNLTKKVNGLGAATGRIGRGFGQLGSGLARAGLVVGGAAVAGLTAAAKSAIDFEDAFAGVRKTVNEADLKAAGLSFEQLAKSFREMATEIPISANEFARLGETAGALGVKAQDIEEFTRVTALMGVTTNLTADEAADAFGRIGTILGLTGDDYEELADSIVNLGNAGASTESEITEITKRFAAQGKAAGLLKEDMVALASATASLGFAPERGGTALARVFANMSTNIALANEKGKALAHGLGRSIKSLQGDIDKGKGLDIFLDVLEEIKGMTPTESARFLKAIGVTNTSDRTIFQTMSQQLPFVNEQLEIARKSQGALLNEATKKFATTASKIQVFKNNLIEAGITIGEQFLPAVGRALDKLTTALKDPATKSDLVQLGKDIGAAIDDIDWSAVLREARSFVGVLKSALEVTMMVVNAINRLPNEIKGAVAGLLVLNKLSGGLVGAGLGNIVGGLGSAAAQGLASRAPGVGKLFAQPVFVTNWPVGMGMGPGGVPGKGGLPSLTALLGPAAIAYIAGEGAAAAVNAQASSLGINAGFKNPFGNMGLNNLTNAFGLIQEFIRVIQNPTPPTPARDTNISDPRDRRGPATPTISDPRDSRPVEKKLEVVRTALENQRKEEQVGRAVMNQKQAEIALAVQRQGERTTASVTDSKMVIAAKAAETARQAALAGRTSANASTTGANRTVAAINAIPAPVVNVRVSQSVSVSSVIKKTTVVKRYGTANGSRNQDSNGSGTLGNGGR